MKFESRLRSLREKKGYSQIQLSKELSISNVTLSQYENGIRKPDIDTLSKLASYFGVTTDYLLGKDTPEEPITIAAHKDGEWTEEELEEIEKFKEFVKMKRGK